MESLPLIHILTFLNPSDWSVIGSLNRSFAFNEKALWLDLHSWKLVLLKSENVVKKNTTRTTRSDSNPRLAFFNALRNRMYAFDNNAHRMTDVLRHSDSQTCIAKIILLEFPINRLFMPCGDSTLLNVAVRFDRWRCVKFLVLKLGADLNMQDPYGMNPLLITSWRGNLKGVKEILKIAALLNTNRLVDNSSPSKNKKKFILDLDCKGSPQQTSVCGGKGPFTAEVWADRKSTVCPENKDFNAIIRLIKKERKEQELLSNRGDR
jgi:ankyrin repeat protein